MEIPFIKIDNAGNDYIYVRKESVSRLRKGLNMLARRISDRNKGVGSDGLIVVDIMDSSSAGIRVFNRDGSEAKLCGNGLRGTILFIRKTTKGRKRHYKITTGWGEYDLDLIKSGSDNIESGVFLGQPSFAADDIGYLGDEKNCMGISLTSGGRKRTLYCIAMPNPHAVIFVDNLDFSWQKEGMEIEKKPVFKDGINVMFARVDSGRKVTVMPWERGSGATLACGSGAAAVTVVSRMLGLTNKKIVVAMSGGNIKTRWEMGDGIYQTGPSRIAFTGLFQI
ncbi:MAG: diaminopimelate epimerase [candidate division Zixibacteria bacterium]